MSKIQWTDDTDNPIRRAGGGHYCIKVSPGCKHCYAEKMNISPWFGWANGKPYRSEKEIPEMELDQGILDGWAKQRKGRKHFVCSMTDWCGEFVPDHFAYKMLDAMIAAPGQTFQLLTKRAKRMSRLVNRYCLDRELESLPHNIWIGISAENQHWLDERLTFLERTPASVRFLSLEPLLGLIYLGSDPIFDWVIVGGESGPGARPLAEAWVTDIKWQCQTLGIPLFIKQLGTVWAKDNMAKHAKGGNPEEWPVHLQVREFPL